MSRPVLVLRPEPGCSETLAAAQERGLRPVAAPLFSIESVEWTVPDGREFDALLVGSANVFRLGGPALKTLRGLPVYAVGERTASAARAMGFTVAIAGAGGLQSVLDGMEYPARVLRLAGEARVDLASPTGIDVVEVAVYRAVPLRLEGKAVQVLGEGAVALLHSGEAARRFAIECDRLGIRRDKVAIAALAPRIAEAAGSGWSEVRTSSEVADSALLALAADMCQ